MFSRVLWWRWKLQSQKRAVQQTRTKMEVETRVKMQLQACMTRRVKQQGRGLTAHIVMLQISSKQQTACSNCKAPGNKLAKKQLTPPAAYR